jgi:excisionase family DNA binding protein
MKNKTKSIERNVQGNWMTENLVTPKQFQTQMDIKKSTYYKWVNEEQLPLYKLGRKVYLKLNEVEGWFRKYKVNQ